ncbi:MAG TPA: ribonuclease Z [Lachnoclostridium phytofermentans]|uniref:Ribonuclease Z n=1 Tax=Lachnoclostridium phytofermentans TaxID=66219 RepID=A0A3D2XB71_9FIRM|nr:MBL fold metallo-hydrolase [Lachnoclostridium sp.]HCL04194.1 ribonuclease Z [Lachnoclostridium phytofermentans]
MKMCSIASGSSGNCIYIGSNETNLLVDAGVSGKRIESGLLSAGVDPNSLNGILITHEHTDHIQGIGVLARRYKLPIYGTVETINAMLRLSSVGRIEESQLRFVKPNEALFIGDILVEPFSISHDASNPVCYTFTNGGHKIGMATDLGTYDSYTISKLCGAEVLYLEANHDVNMLMVGSYPYHLKQRIVGERGHLSNETSAKLICELLHDKLQHVLLAHMSKENNYAELAYETVRCEVEQSVTSFGKMPVITVANRDIPSEMVII